MLTSVVGYDDHGKVYLVLEDFEAWPLEEFVSGLGQPASEMLLWRLLDQLLAPVRRWLTPAQPETAA